MTPVARERDEARLDRARPVPIIVPPRHRGTHASCIADDRIPRARAIDPRRVAVEHNLAILKRSLFSDTLVHDGDRVEIVNFVGGG